MNWPDDFIDKVICADCMDVLPQIPDNSVDLVLTDPPYNVGKEFQNDNLQVDEYDLFNENWITHIHRILKDSGCFFMTYYAFGLDYIMPLLKSFDWKLANIIIWKYPNLISGGWDRCRYEFNYQPILFCKKKNFKIDIQGKNFGIDIKQDVWEFTACQSNFKSDNLKKLHPTQKPVELFKKIIKDTTIDENLVLDPFLGSGTTAVAAKKLNRHFIGIEISEEYCNIARKRLANIPPRLETFTK